VLTVVGQTIALACNSNPTKVTGSEPLLPRLQILLEGYRKVDPPTKKMLPVQVDVPELLVEMAYKLGSSEWDKSTANLTMIAFYYLLCIGIQSKVQGTTQSRWYSSSTRTSPSSAKTTWDICDASLGMHPMNS
jgi:hypothetical protein